MTDPRKGDRAGGPDYKVYRSRRSPLDSLRSGGDLDGLRDRVRGRPEGPERGRRDRGRRARGPITPRRVIRWFVTAVIAWIAISFVLFMVSAQLEGGIGDDADGALSGNGNFFTGATTLVLGTDERKGESIDESDSGPARADSIMVVHSGFATVRKLSIPRDAEADIPGHDRQKINAAYALGGRALMIDTVEQYLGNGLEINHLIEVDFADFPKFIDALGGITVNNKSRICSPEFDNFYRGFRVRKGEVKLNGRRALGFARVRKNNCAPGENDLDRAERQQEVFGGIRRKLLSPGTFVRLPLVSWRAPQTIRTDMKGPGLLGLFATIATGGTGATRVLEPSCLGCGAAGSLQVPAEERAAAVRQLQGDD